MNDSQHIAQIGLNPVSVEKPCGVNIRYEPAFEALESEMAKQESLNTAIVDWNIVADLSSKILKDSSKDLLVGCYLSQALLVNDGYPGLASGLKILNDMVDNYWDDLFPPVKRLRARQTPFVWLAEKASEYINDHVPTENDATAVIAASESLKQLDNSLLDKMADQAPVMSDLNRLLKNYKQSFVAEQEKNKPADASVVNESLVDGDSPTQIEKQVTATPVAKVQQKKSIPAQQTVSTVSSDTEVKKALRQLQESSRPVINYWQTSKLSDPRAYRLARMMSWIMIDNVPPSTDGITQVNGPAEDRLKYFDLQLEKSEFITVLPELESTLLRSPFWLDGQNKVVTVLRGLGGEYEAAAQTVIHETKHFLERLPDLINLSFADQVPFASDQTKMWLESEVLTENESRASDTNSVTSGTAEEWDTVLSEAKKKAAGGDIDTAIFMLNSGVKTASQERDRYYWRCALADLLLSTGSVKAATGILQQLVMQAKKNEISDWEPALLARIYKLLYLAYKKQQAKKKEDKTIQELIDQAYAKLCWFDPVTALTVKEG